MISIGVLTISDSGAKGAREDTSGERIRKMVDTDAGGRHQRRSDYSR